MTRFSTISLILIVCITGSACGGSSDEKEAGDSNPVEQTEELLSFPLDERLYLYSHDTGSIFSLPDQSAWLITGAVGGRRAGMGYSSVTIFEGANRLPDAEYGIKSDYYMTVTDTAATFFVTPLYLKSIAVANGDFYGEEVGSVFALDDNSSWLVTGLFGGSNRAARGSATASIYEVTSEVPAAVKGVASGYIMTLSSGPGASGASFYVERLQ